ncbi:MAG: DEAD/DEAH box helicase [Planctomycetes bacterium]|nr:DEAD/DEAH box helicase [Planctomycetota bacterium]MBL7041316.1 DEAD/DEAH box helicase [Pirellulaceae bacterium]
MATKKSSQLTLRDKLSRLTFDQARKLLGEEGSKLIAEGGKYEIDIDHQVRLDDKRFELRFFDGPGTIVTIRLEDSARRRLQWHSNTSNTACEKVGAAFSLILEEKMSLGLAEPPEEELPLECLNEEQLLQRAIRERKERARTEKMKLRSVDPSNPWTEYTITSAESGKTYRLMLRGDGLGQSSCSCPDFRANRIGTCKHIMHALEKVKRRFPAAVRHRPYKCEKLLLHMNYGHELSLGLEVPDRVSPEVARIVRPIRDRTIDDVHELVKIIARLERLGAEVTITPDAEEYIQQQLFQDRIKDRVAEIRKDPANHPFRTELLKADLLPYQLDGIAFAVGAGRAVLADDMGLGKTIQGVGAAELLAREADIRRVLVICPASLKSQWRNEIHRFSDRDCQLVVGAAADRAEQYDNDCFFTVCNYEQVLRDILSIERVKWDLIILDEGQRIKNWEAKTSGIVKSLRSPFALVLSGTPLENRLDELYSVVQFIDDRRLAPAFRFFNRHRVVDENGKVLGYKNLDHLRENLKPILLRRTRGQVMKQLPPRTTEVVRIPPTDEQLEVHAAHSLIVQTIINKKYLTEMDILRLQKALLMCRMVANSTFLITKQQPAYSSKLDRLSELFDQLFQEEDRKAVLFSEWTTMLNLIEPLAEQREVDFVRLDGSVPQKKRQQLVHQFQNDPECKLFITTNAGSTGLNLQAANTIVNVDLPWNPAVLEQRIARAHRMGQRRPVQVFVLVTEDTIEDRLLATLSAKHELALAALDVNSDVDRVDLASGMEELKRRLEVLLGAKPEAAVDESVKAEREREAQLIARRERVAAAGGELLGAAFGFLGELMAEHQETDASKQLAVNLKSRLTECVNQDETGKQQLTVTLPDKAALDNLASSLARLLAAGQSGPG